MGSSLHYYVATLVSLCVVTGRLTHVHGFSPFQDQPQGLSREKIKSLAWRRFKNNNNDKTIHQNTDQQPMRGRVAVVTGAAGGIGGEVSKLLYSLGATVVALDRNEEGLENLRESLGVNDDDDDDDKELQLQDNYNRFQTIPTHQENLRDVAQVANDIQTNFPTIDLLVNAAGLAYPQDDPEGLLKQGKLVSAHGKDLAFTVNYLSHVLLTEKLLPNLSRATQPNARIVHITSTFHWKVDGSELLPTTHDDDDDDNADDPLAYRTTHQSPFHVQRSYANTKLAQLWYSRSLARRCHDDDETGVSSVCACPTWAATGIAGEAGRDFLQSMAFGVTDCGPGMTSTINAMFRTDDELGDAIGEHGSSFVANSRTVELLWGIDTWLAGDWTTNVLNLRDGLTDLLAVVLLVCQRFTHDELIIQRTSPESFNDKDKMDRFYHWSQEAIKPWVSG